MTATAAVDHSGRFRQMGTGYARAVALAYHLDLAEAMADDAGTVAARVADWERSNGWEPRDWAAIGREEGHPGVDPGPCWLPSSNWNRVEL